MCWFIIIVIILLWVNCSHLQAMFCCVQQRQTLALHQEEQQKLARERDELQKKCSSMARLSVQFQHGIRRKELEYEKLQDKLRYYLAEKKREAKASMEIFGRLKKQSQQGKSKMTTKMDEEMVKVMIDLSEA